MNKFKYVIDNNIPFHAWHELKKFNGIVYNVYCYYHRDSKDRLCLSANISKIEEPLSLDGAPYFDSKFLIENGHLKRIKLRRLKESLLSQKELENRIERSKQNSLFYS